MPNDENGDDLNKDDEIELEEDTDKTETQNGEEILPEKIKSKIWNNQSLLNDMDKDQSNENLEEEPIVTDGEIILTHTVERGIDTMFHTVDIKEDNSSVNKKDHKEYIKNQLDKWFDVSFGNFLF